MGCNHRGEGASKTYCSGMVPPGVHRVWAYRPFEEQVNVVVLDLREPGWVSLRLIIPILGELYTVRREIEHATQLGVANGRFHS